MVQRALDLIGDLLVRKPGIAGLTWLAVGAGDPSWDNGLPPLSPTATALRAELFRVPLDASSFTVDDAKHSLTIQTVIPAAKITQTIREFGVFGGDASALPGSGYLFSYRVHAAIAPPQANPLVRQITITWNVPNLLAGA